MPQSDAPSQQAGGGLQLSANVPHYGPTQLLDMRQEYPLCVGATLGATSFGVDDFLPKESTACRAHSVAAGPPQWAVFLWLAVGLREPGR